MQAALILVEDHRGDDQANEQGAHDGGAEPGCPALNMLDLHTESLVTNAVSQRSHQKHLLEGEDAESGQTVIVEERGRDQAAERPIDNQSS